MLGPIMRLMAIAQRQNDMQMPERPPGYKSIYDEYLERMSVPQAERPPFRDPMQGGPAPPTGMGPISQLYRGR